MSASHEAQERISFNGTEDKWKKAGNEEHIVSVTSAATTPLTTLYNTPDVLTPKEEKDLDVNDILVFKACQDASSPTFNHLNLDEISRQRSKARRYEYFCLGSVCWVLLLSGWGDGSNGPLIPRMQEYYSVSPHHLRPKQTLLTVDLTQIDYTVVSMIFVPYCAVSFEKRALSRNG